MRTDTHHEPRTMSCEVVTQRDLNAQRCSNPGCTQTHPQLTLAPDCHPQAGLVIVYDKSTGLMSMGCNGCGAFICDVLIARQADA